MNISITTYTKKSFELLNPQPEAVCIEDIAHSLAYQCRYTGHTRQFYSIAQHCVLMAMNDDLPGDPMVKLLHDASETYIGDMARPWKVLLRVDVPETKLINRHYVLVGDFEQEILNVIGLALDVDLSHCPDVKEADLRMMATEVRDLMPEMPPDFVWGHQNRKPVEDIIIPWQPKSAGEIFLAVYKMLNLKRTKV